MSALAREAGIVARRPLGLIFTAWAYTWRITPLHRTEEEGDPARDAPPAFPQGVSLEGVQHLHDGHGPLMHRRYRVDVVDADMSAEELIACVREDPNRVVPRGLAHFRADHGDGPLGVGDVYTVRMPGPWNGPVRVVAADATSFRFATLDGHLEAGQIAWRAEQRDGALRFEVESWACPGSRMSHFAHHKLRMAKEVQLHMWTSVLEKVAALAGGRMRDGAEIRTWIVG